MRVENCKNCGAKLPLPKGKGRPWTLCEYCRPPRNKSENAPNKSNLNEQHGIEGSVSPEPRAESRAAECIQSASPILDPPPISAIAQPPSEPPTPPEHIQILGKNWYHDTQPTDSENKQESA